MIEVDETRTQRIAPGLFEAEAHYYPRTLNAQTHPLVRFFLQSGNDRIAARYTHLHPRVSKDTVLDLLSYRPKYFRWAGSDLFVVTDEEARRRVVVIETNSSPSGQKSMPFSHSDSDLGGYRALLSRSFLPVLERRGLPKGALAVLYDKNPMETSGYAAALAELTGQDVYLAPYFEDDPSHCRFDDKGVLHVRDGEEWIPIRAALRYVTQRPWNRIPVYPRTALFNPPIACLAGGRNKLVAAKAYDLLNAEVRHSGLEIVVPETIWDISKPEVPLWVDRMGGAAVVKDPYSNAGQGVWTITCPAELDAFMEIEHRYERFIVQQLIGNSGWSSAVRKGRLYHLGTVPNRQGNIFVADIRMMIGASPDGFYPIAVYARRARDPLTETLEGVEDSWPMLGTNLSYRKESGAWGSEPERLLLMDNRDFNRLGVGYDDLVEGYLQSVMAVVGIDKMARRLMNERHRLRKRLFASVNPDPSLVREIYAPRERQTTDTPTA